MVYNFVSLGVLADKFYQTGCFVQTERFFADTHNDRNKYSVQIVMLNVCEASLGLIILPSAVTLCRQRDSSLTLRMTKINTAYKLSC